MSLVREVGSQRKQSLLGILDSHNPENIISRILQLLAPGKTIMLRLCWSRDLKQPK